MGGCVGGFGMTRKVDDSASEWMGWWVQRWTGWIWRMGEWELDGGRGYWLMLRFCLFVLFDLDEFRFTFGRSASYS